MFLTPCLNLLSTDLPAQFIRSKLAPKKGALLNRSENKFVHWLMPSRHQKPSLHRFLVHMIYDNHWDGSLLFHQPESKLSSMASKTEIRLRPVAATMRSAALFGSGVSHAKQMTCGKVNNCLAVRALMKPIRSRRESRGKYVSAIRSICHDPTGASGRRSISTPRTLPSVLRVLPAFA